MEMEYINRRCDPYRLADGKYRDLRYYVLSLGTHPCAYIEVNDLIDAPFDINAIDCHGGITYSREYLATVDHKGWFIGWDYAHCYDYSGNLPETTQHCKKWTTSEIVTDCKAVIDQIWEKARTDNG